MSRLGLLATILLTSVALAGDSSEDQTPKSPAARSALAKLANAQDAAKKAYDKAMKEAAGVAVKDLEAAKAIAMKGSNLDEANRIQAAIEHIQAAGRRKYLILARESWQPTVAVERGQKVSIKAEGKWCYYTRDRANATVSAAGGMRDGKRYGVLIGRVGEGAPFEVGEEKSFVAGEAGTLELSMHDDGRDDNDGEITVLIAVPQTP